MDLRLTGRTAVVVGSTSGLGEAIAIALGREGAKVVITGRRKELAERLAGTLPRAIGVGLDISEQSSIESVMSTAEARFGGVDILVLNSGGPPPVTAVDLDPQVLLSALDTLLIRQIAFVARVLPAMRRQRWGRILAVGSSGIQEPLSNLVISNVGRTALAAYLKTLAMEVMEDGVTVNMVLPGRIDTARVAGLDGVRAERLGIAPSLVRQQSEQLIPARRYGRPDEFGAIACFLCSELASYVTGEQIRVDGGLARGY